MSSPTEDIEDFTFDRPCTAPLTKSCSGPGTPPNWPKKFDQIHESIALLTGQIKKSRKDIGKFEVNMADLPAHPEYPKKHNLMIWKKQISTAFLVEGYTNDQFANLLAFLKAPSSEETQGLTLGTVKPGKYVLVCSHAHVDPRCGYCGPKLADLFIESIKEEGYNELHTLVQVSHVGGHKYAGNVIVYPEGVWYGYVKPANVPEFFAKCVLGDEILHDLYRGKMGLSNEEQKALGTKPGETL